MIKMVNASYRYFRDKNIVLKNINFHINQGDIVGITSIDGGGKSSFIKTFFGFLFIVEGNTYYRGRDISTYKKKEIRSYLRDSYYLTSTSSAIQIESVYENLQRALPHRTLLSKLKIISKEEEEIIYNVLNKVGLTKFAFDVVQSLNDTDKARLELARLIISKRKYIFADDPTSKMEKRFSKEFVHLLIDYCKTTGATLVYASNDDELVDAFFKKKYEIQNKRLIRITN